jgi:hypothetical protein
MRAYILIFILILTTTLVTDLVSQDLYNARSLGMAGSNYAIAEGNEYIGGNPALLAPKRSFDFEILLAGAHAMVKNNSFSYTEYEKYFTTGDSLTQNDIDDLFGNVPDDGWTGDFTLGARALSIYARPFSLSIGGLSNGFMDVPKNALQIPFYGNSDLREYNIEELDGEAWGGASIDFGIGFPLTDYVPAEFDYFSVGLNAKYLVGLEYANIQYSEGKLITNEEFLLLDARIETRRSDGGNGYGLDIGAFGVYEQKWILSFHVTNILGDLYWNNTNTLEVLMYESDSLFRFEDIGNLSKAKMDTSYTIGNFKTALPRSATFSAAYYLQPNLVLTGTFRQGLNKVLGNTTTPRISVGTEYKPIPVIPLRAGIALGGDSGFALGLGFGIDAKIWQLNIGYLNHNFRWFNGARSVDLAVSTQFRF